MPNSRWIILILWNQVNKKISFNLCCRLNTFQNSLPETISYFWEIGIDDLDYFNLRNYNSYLLPSLLLNNFLNLFYLIRGSKYK
jgi:hypothetical protein